MQIKERNGWDKTQRRYIMKFLLGIILLVISMNVTAEQTAMPEDVPIGVQLCGVSAFMIIDGKLLSHQHMNRESRKLYDKGQTDIRIIEITRLLPIDCNIIEKASEPNEKTA